MGNKTGKPRGRPKGSRNKITSAASARQIAMRQTPLEFMLEIMWDTTNEHSVRLDAAKAAAPYTHARLQSITVQERPYDGDSATITNDQLTAIIQGTGGGDDAPAKKGSRTIN